jgi:hypothetical protein
MVRFGHWIIIIIKKNGKVFPEHNIKACTGSEGTAPLILNLGTRWRRRKETLNNTNIKNPDLHLGRPR